MTSQKPVRILQVGKYYPPDMGGIETHLQTLCGELRDVVDVRAVVSSGGKDAWVDKMDGIPVARAATPWNLSGAPISPSMVRVIRRSRAGLVHLHLPNPAAVLAYLVSGHRGPLVVTYHSDVVRQRVLGAAFEPILHHVLRRADAIIVSTPDYLESSPILARHQSRCRVIPFGIPLEQFDSVPHEAVDRIRREHGSPLILAVGRLVYYKGFEFLVDAMRKVDANLVIVGQGPLRPMLEARIRAHGLEDRVSLIGHVPDVLPFYHAADLFVLPSITRSEAFGIVQLEAMACGKPVINTRLDSGVPFVSQHRKTGLTVRPSDPDALAEAMADLLEDESERLRLGVAARERVETEFAREVMGERTLRLYEEVLGRPILKANDRSRRGSWRVGGPLNDPSQVQNLGDRAVV